MKPTNNYLPWLVKETDFPHNKSITEKAKFLIRYALLAPSSHNTQPWKFSIKQNRINIFLDEQRRLLYSDRANREAFISLGCALENIIIATNHFNLYTQVNYLPEFDLESPVITVTLKPY